MKGRVFVHRERKPGLFLLAKRDAMQATLEAPESEQADQFGAAVRHEGDFDESIFVNIPNVPVFAEHSTTTEDGRQLTFGYHELKAVCDRCNRRIADTGDYAAITIGHTPSPEAKSQGSGEPDFIGLAGPFRMGTIGNGDRVRHAILCDFHVYREDYYKLRKHPRRSPELWLEDTFAEMFLDPIALLGAEAPRLDMGLLYAAEHQGRRKHKYSAVSPGPANASLPSTDIRRYEGDSGMVTGQEVNPETIQTVMAAFEQSEMGQFIKAMMAERAAGGTDGMAAASATEANEPVETPPVAPAAPPADMGGAPPAPPAPAGPPEVPPAEDPAAPPAVGGGVDDEADKELYAALDEVEDEKLEQYMSHRKSRNMKAYQAEAAEGEVEGDPLTGEEGEIGDLSTPESGSISYSRNGAGHNTLHYARQIRHLTDQNSQLTKRASELEGRAINAERKAFLTGLVADGYPINPDEELGTAKQPGRLHYSRCKEAEFVAHTQFILDKVQRAPIGDTLLYSRGGEKNAPGRPSTAAKQQYTAEQSEQAFHYCKKKKASGETVDYAKVLKAIAAGEPLE